MATTQAQKEAQKKYDAVNTKQLHLKLNTNSDAAILKWLEGIPNVQGYIKRLIIDDMGVAEKNALETIAKQEAIVEAAEQMREAGATEEEVDTWAEEHPSPDISTLLHAKHIHELCTTKTITKVELDRIQNIMVWGQHKMDVKDIKDRLGLSWSEMEAIHMGQLKLRIESR